MRLDRKGISPLIASVLLLAFALTIAGMFSEWGNGLFMNAKDRNTKQQKQLLNCNNMRIEITSVKENYGSNNLQVVLKDHGGKIGNVTVIAYPSIKRGYVSNNLTEDNQVETVNIPVGTQQDKITAASLDCSLSSTEKLN
ncbi:MAG: archaellin/type IV pilin N-terminal domain-containing protein [Candidatus Nanohaloarchaea archaeon]